MDSKYIGKAWPTVIAEGTEDEVLPLLIEDQYSRQHLGSDAKGDLATLNLGLDAELNEVGSPLTVGRELPLLKYKY